MSKRVKIAVIREATLNAKPTDTHYLAEGGLQISRRDARALKGTTLYYEVLVDLGEVKGFDFIPGRDVPVYLTDSESVLALDPQSLKLVDVKETFVEKTGSITCQSITVDHSILAQNVAVEPIDPVSSVTLPVIPASVIVHGAPVQEAPPAKRRPGRPKKIVDAAAPVTYTLAEPVVAAPEVKTVLTVQAQDANEFVEVVAEPDFVVTEKQDDESTFLIDPEGAPAPVVQPKPEFSFDVDEDEAPPPPARTLTPQNLGFEVEDEEETPARAEAPVEKPEAIVSKPLSTDDFSDVAPGLFDE